MTQQQIEEHQKKHGFPSPFGEIEQFIERGRKAQKAVSKLLAAPVPNKTEAEFEQIHLLPQKSRGEIRRYEYHGITLRYGSLKYTPDWFVVVSAYGSYSVKLRCIEVKGEHTPPMFMQHAAARFKGARDAYPEIEFQFWQKEDGIWIQRS